MGFLRQALDKSLFSDNTYNKAIGKFTKGVDGQNNFDVGYGAIKISPNNPRTGSTSKDPFIVGMIQNDVEFNIDAEWSEMGGGLISQLGIPGSGKLSKVLDFFKTAANVGGIADVGSVYASRKIYHKSGYLTINPEIRVINWNDDGAPIAAADLLIYLTTPNETFNEEGQEITDMAYKGVQGAKREFTNLVNNTADSAGVVGKLLTNTIGASVEGAKNVAGEVQDLAVTAEAYLQENMPETYRMSKDFVKSQSEEIDDLWTLRASPPPVIVEIGEFFKHTDMVIESVDVKFSKEVTRSGPMYADFSLKLSSRHIIRNASDSGLHYPKKWAAGGGEATSKTTFYRS